MQHALAGEGGPAYDTGAWRFDPDDLVPEAELRAGTDDFGDDDHVEPLSVFCRSVESEAGLHLVGRWRCREVLLRALENKLRLTAYAGADPGVRDEPIEAPVIVTGSPRAGTSILHELLAVGDDRRAPMAWEYWWPAPPPDPDGAALDPRIPLADRDVRLSAALAPQFDGMHEQGAQVPREDPSGMLPSLRSDVLSTHYPTPSYAAWLAEADMAPAYDLHRLVLQVLQRGWPRRTWVLKAPGHLANLELVLERYPDARIVVCHRDPLSMISSVTSLTATLRGAHAESVDLTALARENVETFARQLDALVVAQRSGLLDEAAVEHVHFDALNADQAGTVGRLCASFGLPFDRSAVDVLLAAKPKGRHGGHQHSFADLGLDEDEVRERFAEYCSEFLPSGA